MSEAALRFFSASEDLLCVVGFDGALREVNQVMASLLGREPGALASAPFVDFVHEDDRRAVRAELERARGGEKVSFACRVRAAGGDYKTIHCSGTPSIEDEAIYFVNRHVAPVRPPQDLLPTFSGGGAESGSDELFGAIVRHLAAVLGVKHAFISRCVDWPVTRVATLAGWMSGEPSENFEYALAGTPCEKVLSGEACYFPSGVQETFADDKFLVEIGCQSYLGAPLIDASGALLGHICALDDRPMSPGNRRWQTDVMRTFAEWSVTEIDRVRAEEAFRKVMEATSSLSGVDFLRSLAQSIAQALEVRCALIAEYVDDPPTQARALAFWKGDGFIDTFEYPLEGAPCSITAKGGVCHYADGVQEEFPDDVGLVRLEAKSYLGIPLHGSSGKQIGHLGVLDRRPMGISDRRVRMLRLFAVRAATEIERTRTEKVAEEKDAQVKLLMRAMSAPIIQAWDGVVVMPVIGVVDRERADQMMETLLGSIMRTRAGFAILDLTGVRSVDMSTAGYLLSIVRAAALLGSRCLISGISPEIARTMVELGVESGGFSTFSTLQSALSYAIRSCSRAGKH